MPDLQPLLSRDRYTDEEWEYASAGRCDVLTANYPGMEWCGKPADPDSFYRWCTEHDWEARTEDPRRYGQ